MSSASALVCGFVPIRGVDQHDETTVRLAEDVVLYVDTADTPDYYALAQTLTYAAQFRWTGIKVRQSPD